MAKDTNRADLRPSYQWYPKDRLADAGVQKSSLAAKGMWADMLDWMFLDQNRGCLTSNGSPMGIKMIAKLMRIGVKRATKLIKELEDNQVFSRLENGTIYCRRMRREWLQEKSLHEVRVKAGEAGAEKRWKQTDSKQHGKPIASSVAKGMAKIASSSSTSSSTSKKKNKNTYTPEFLEFREAYPHRINNPWNEALKKWKGRLKEGWKAEELIAAAGFYGEYCRLKGKKEEHIKQAATFLGNAADAESPFEEFLHGVPRSQRAIDDEAIEKERETEPDDVDGI